MDNGHNVDTDRNREKDTTGIKRTRTGRGGHAQLFFFLSPQSQFHNLKEALPQSQFHNFLKKCCSAIPQSQFYLMSATSSPQLESFISAIFGIFLAMESGRGLWKNRWYRWSGAGTQGTGKGTQTDKDRDTDTDVSTLTDNLQKNKRIESVQFYKIWPNRI